MNLTVRDHATAFVVAPTGRIDHGSADPFLLALQEMIPTCTQGSRPLILDFSAVQYISSAGLRSLMVAARQIKTAGGRIGIAGPQPLVREVFAIARFELVVPCFEDVDAAARSLA